MMIVLLVLFSVTAQAAEVCATKYSELVLTPKLASIKTLFDKDRRANLVNGTKGSYVIVDAAGEGDMTISFFTTGIFDLYGVRKDGPLRFCDDGEHLRMIGLDRADIARIEDGVLIFGDGGDRRSFAAGNMPELLQRKHKLGPRGVASEPK